MFWNRGTKKQDTNYYPDDESATYAIKLWKLLEEEATDNTNDYTYFYTKLNEVQEEKQNPREENTLYQVRRAAYLDLPVIRIYDNKQYQALLTWAEAKGVDYKDVNHMLLVADDKLNVSGLYAVYYPKQNTLKILKQDTALKDSSFRRPLFAKPILSVYDAIRLYGATTQEPHRATETPLGLVKKNGTHQVTIDRVQYEVQGSVTLEGKVVVK